MPCSHCPHCREKKAKPSPKEPENLKKWEEQIARILAGKA